MTEGWFNDTNLAGFQQEKRLERYVTLKEFSKGSRSFKLKIIPMQNKLSN
jgi:hypothetical protein